MDLKTMDSLKELIRKDASEDDCSALAAFCNHRAGELKTTRQDKARQEADALVAEAREQARLVLEKAGLAFIEDTRRGKKRVKAAKPSGSLAVYKSGHRYQHPDKPELTWNGHGKKPEWEKDVVARGGKLIDLGEMPKPDSIKRAG